MTRRIIIPRDLAARELSVSAKVLARYESLGWIEVVKDGNEEGYDSAQIRRLWSIVTYQRDLGVNLAGVEIILQLVDHLSHVHHRVYHLTEELRTILDDDGDPGAVADSHA